MKEIKLDRRILSFKEYEAAKIISELVGSKKSVLNVGAFWGRDYYFLSNQRKNVTNVDIVNNGLPNTKIIDITSNRIKLKNKFDVVLIPEVLEHLFKDFKALKNARKILEDDGFLIITIPLFNDFAGYHVRIHSPKTIKRLLESEGFKIERMVYRGNLISFSRPINGLSKVIGLINYDLRIKYLDLLVKIDEFIGNNSFPAKLSKFYGLYILAKRGDKRDFKEVNIKEFKYGTKK